MRLATLAALLPSLGMATLPLTPHQRAWTIDANGEVIWNGAAFRPQGSQATAAGTAGASLIEIGGPSRWDEAVEAGETSGRPYAIRMTGPAKKARGWTVRPASYRITDAGELTTMGVDLPGMDEALVVIATRRDGVVQSFKRTPVLNGRLAIDVPRVASADQKVVLIYPLGQTEEIDLWEGWDLRRDELSVAIARKRPGPLFRALGDPAGALPPVPEEAASVPTSPLFRTELRNLLETRYRSIDTAMRAWGIPGAAIESFGEMARLVPLWQGVRGVKKFYDPEKNALFDCASNRSQTWTDLSDAIRGVTVRRHGRLTGSLRDSLNAPIFTTWTGWSSVVEDKDSGYDGLFAEVSGDTPDAMTSSLARPLSSALRRGAPTTLWAVGAPATADRDLLARLGVSGAFGPGLAGGDFPASSRPTPIYYPEAATNPAAPMTLGGNALWTPVPSRGAPLDLGPGFWAYRFEHQGRETFALWTDRPGRYKFLANKPEAITVTSVVTAATPPKTNKQGLEFDLGAAPTLITGASSIPVPIPALEAAKARFDALVKLSGERRRDIGQEEQVVRRALSEMTLEPGMAFLNLTAALESIEQRVGAFTWIEAEMTRETSFGEARVIPGCSGNAALTLQNRVAQPTAYFAEYQLPIRTPNDQTLWIGCRTANGKAPPLVVLIGRQRMELDPTPRNRYGQGFAWYGYGLTKLGSNAVPLRIEVDGGVTNDLAIDAIVLTPGSAPPDGIRMLRASGN